MNIDLPDPDEPLPTARGLIPPRTSLRTTVTEVPTNAQAVKIVAGARRKAAEMPMPPKQMNAIGLICFYTMWGLDDREIAVTTGIPEKQIRQAKMSTEYARIQDVIVGASLDADDGDVRNYIKRHASSAATKMVELLDGDEKVAVRAAADILDRAGHRAADRLMIEQTMNVGLRIEVVEKDKQAKGPVIDMEVADGDSN